MTTTASSLTLLAWDQLIKLEKFILRKWAWYFDEGVSTLKRNRVSDSLEYINWFIKSPKEEEENRNLRALNLELNINEGSKRYKSKSYHQTKTNTNIVIKDDSHSRDCSISSQASLATDERQQWAWKEESQSICSSYRITHVIRGFLRELNFADFAESTFSNFRGDLFLRIFDLYNFHGYLFAECECPSFGIATDHFGSTLNHFIK